MLVILHLCVALFCAFECAAAMSNTRGKFTKIIMFGGLGVIHGLVPALTPRSMMWPGASSGTLVAAAALALIGVVVFSLGWRAYEGRRPQWQGPSPGLQAVIDSPEGQRLLRRMFWLCAVVSVACWLLALTVQAGSLRAAWESGRFEYRGYGHTYTRVILRHAANLMVVPGFVGFFLPRRYRLIGIAFALAMATAYFIGTHGARLAPMALIGSLVMGYTLRQRVDPRRLVLIGAAGAVVLLLAVALYEVRKVMSHSTYRELGEIIVSAETYQDALVRDPLHYHQYLVAAVKVFPKDHPYLNGATYRRLLVFYLPRRYFESIKGEDTHNVFARAVTTYTSKWIIMPTMMGDGYINFWGAPGVVIVMLWNGLLFGLASQKMRENMLWFLVIAPEFMRFALAAIRGSPYEILTWGLSTTVFVWLLGTACGFSYRGAKSKIKYIDKTVRFGVTPSAGQVSPPEPRPSAIPRPPGSA